MRTSVSSALVARAADDDVTVTSNETVTDALSRVPYSRAAQ